MVLAALGPMAGFTPFYDPPALCLQSAALPLRPFVSEKPLDVGGVLTQATDTEAAVTVTDDIRQTQFQGGMARGQNIINMDGSAMTDTRDASGAGLDDASSCI